jgi:hypothetical protein
MPVGRQLLSHDDFYTQLFFYFSYEARRRFFAIPDLASGEFPFSREIHLVVSLSEKDSTGTFYDGASHFSGLHAMPA